MDSFSSSRLGTALAALLTSRDARQIRRRLPEPGASTTLIDFTSNDYLSLSSSSHLRSLFLRKLSESRNILGSGGSRLLVNGHAHSQLELRLKIFFGTEEALLFNSGYDANVALFECIPQPGDAVIYDEYVHASVHDGIRASRVGKEDRLWFRHNDVADLKNVLTAVRGRTGTNIFVAVESVYSMDGTLAPLEEICDAMEEADGYLIVDEAHATGLYGPGGRGRVAMAGLESRVLARLCTFGKALGANGAVLLTNRLIRDYMLNYARPLIYTTGMSYANVIAVDCSFDFLENGVARKLATQLFDLIKYFLAILEPRLQGIPVGILSLPPRLDLTPIIPLHTQYPRQLSAHLLRLGMNARPITWPTVPKGKDRVRICLHAGNTKDEIEHLACAASEWALDMKNSDSKVILEGKL
ncbi:hypothetical protein AX15_001044 [Amanita polypyramis BW_CC]|nr:hypothetical protein AX15_001044 [Amanita polypyramis BW_CC]